MSEAARLYEEWACEIRRQSALGLDRTAGGADFDSLDLQQHMAQLAAGIEDRLAGEVVENTQLVGESDSVAWLLARMEQLPVNVRDHLRILLAAFTEARRTWAPRNGLG